MLSFSCPKCGGTTKFDETKEIPTYCMFCGAHLPDMTDFVKESLKLGLDKQRHDMDMESKKQQIRIAKTNTLSTKLIVLLAFAAFGFMIYLTAVLLNR